MHGELHIQTVVAVAHLQMHGELQIQTAVATAHLPMHGEVHIQTVVDRDYVIERMEGAIKYLVPSKLGIGLVDGYNEIGFERSLSKPQLRREVGSLFIK